jgi:hypothetical protein
MDAGAPKSIKGTEKVEKETDPHHLDFIGACCPFGLQNPRRMAKTNARTKQLNPMMFLIKVITAVPPGRIAPGILCVCSNTIVSKGK